MGGEGADGERWLPLRLLFFSTSHSCLSFISPVWSLLLCSLLSCLSFSYPFPLALCLSLSLPPVSCLSLSLSHSSSLLFFDPNLARHPLCTRTRGLRQFPRLARPLNLRSPPGQQPHGEKTAFMLYWKRVCSSNTLSSKRRRVKKSWIAFCCFIYKLQVSTWGCCHMACT